MRSNRSSQASVFRVGISRVTRHLHLQLPDPSIVPRLISLDGGKTRSYQPTSQSHREHDSSPLLQYLIHCVSNSSSLGGVMITILPGFRKMISNGDQEASTALRAALVQWKKRLQAIACLLLKSDMDLPHLRVTTTRFSGSIATTSRRLAT
jgi:hypothetical protein